MKPTEGLFPGISREHYDSIEAINQTILKKAVDTCPAKARWEQLHPKEPTDALIFGQALHHLVLEPLKFRSEWCPPLMDDEGVRVARRGKKNLEAWSDHEAKHPGALILDLSSVPLAWSKIHLMRRALFAHPGAKKVLIGPGLNECAMVWQDPDTGLWCKALIDRIATGGAVQTFWDLKSCASAHPRVWARQAADLKYHLQAGFYLAGARVLEERQRMFGFLCIEKEEPYVVKPYLAKPSVIEQGESEARAALRLWDRCLQQNRFPAYGTTIDEFHLPEWAYREVT